MLPQRHPTDMFGSALLTNEQFFNTLMFLKFSQSGGSEVTNRTFIEDIIVDFHMFF